MTSRADWEAPPPLKTNKNDADPGGATLLCTRKVSMRNAQCCGPEQGGGGQRTGDRGGAIDVQRLASVLREVGRACREKGGMMWQQ